MTTGQQLRFDGIEANLAAATAPHRSYRDHAETILAQYVRDRVEFTADDIHRRIPDGIEPHSHNVLPSLIRLYSVRGSIDHIGWVSSTRPTRHASVNRVWRGTGP